MTPEAVWTERDEQVRREFARLVAKCESVSLVRMALQIAQGEYPELLVETLIERFDEIADAVRAMLPEGATDGDKIHALNKYLFQTLKLTGDTEYSDPKNCYINELLSSRTGLPISLCILYLDVAGRLELKMIGVGLPGHFVVRYVGHGAIGDVFVDPFHEGKVLSRDDCVDLVARLTRGRLPWHDDYLKSASNRHIVTRLLNNLKGAYARHADQRRGLRIQNYLLTLHPNMAHEFRDRGVILMELESFRGALDDLKHYLELAPNAVDADQIRVRIIDLEHAVRRLC